jgi:hypothetical protein
VWSGFFWLRIRTSSRFICIFGVFKSGIFFWVDGQLLDSVELILLVSVLGSTRGVQIRDRLFFIVIRKDLSKENYDIRET